MLERFKKALQTEEGPLYDRIAAHANTKRQRDQGWNPENPGKSKMEHVVLRQLQEMSNEYMPDVC